MLFRGQGNFPEIKTNRKRNNSDNLCKK